MNGKQRRQIMLQLAATQGGISTREMADRFQVSRMTIHRDIGILDQAGQLKRIHGGALPRTATDQTRNMSYCSTCEAAICSHQRYVQRLPQQDKVFYCCAGCGLKAQLRLQAPATFFATDLISGKSIPAEAAYYLIRSSATPCCQPSILTFAEEADAASFQSGFGGVLGRLTETLTFLRTEQNLLDSN